MDRRPDPQLPQDFWSALRPEGRCAGQFTPQKRSFSNPLSEATAAHQLDRTQHDDSDSRDISAPRKIIFGLPRLASEVSDSKGLYSGTPGGSGIFRGAHYFDVSRH
jgi:hypothetical protein